MRQYTSTIADSSRWRRIPTQPGDIVVSSPSKSGTTWVQQIVVRLVLGRAEVDRPVSDISPWFDARTHHDDEIVALLEGQEHRRVLKTHTPLDGVPAVPDVRYVALARHPLDLALSFRDHLVNLNRESLGARIDAAMGLPDRPPSPPPPEDDLEFLAWFVDNDEEFSAAGPAGLAEYCHTIATTWARRDEPNVHLLHYDDLSADPIGRIAELARFLATGTSPSLVEEIANATSFDALRADAEANVPFAGLDSFVDPSGFFRVGGSRNAESVLDDELRRRFERGMERLPEDARRWALGGFGTGPTS